jgi:hypothetical protein
MAIMEGDRFKDKLTGQSFVAKRIIDGAIILEAEDTPNRFCLGAAIVELLFEREEDYQTMN